MAILGARDGKAGDVATPDPATRAPLKMARTGFLGSMRRMKVMTVTAITTMTGCGPRLMR